MSQHFETISTTSELSPDNSIVSKSGSNLGLQCNPQEVYNLKPIEASESEPKDAMQDVMNRSQDNLRRRTATTSFGNLKGQTRGRSRTFSSGVISANETPPPMPAIPHILAINTATKLPSSLQRIGVLASNVSETTSQGQDSIATKSLPRMPQLESGRSSASSMSKLDLKKVRMLSSEEIKAIVKSNQELRTINPIIHASGEGFYHDLTAIGFPVMWKHPLLHLYFVLFLLDRKKFPLYLFLLDISEFKNSYFQVMSSQRHQKMYKIFQTYLNENGPYYLVKYLPLASEKDRLIFDIIQSRLNMSFKSVTENLFDDLNYVVLESLASLCTSNLHITETFFESAACQAMITDFGKCKTLSQFHLEKIFYRFLDLPPVTVKIFGVRIGNLLDRIATYWRFYPTASNFLEECNNVTNLKKYSKATHSKSSLDSDDCDDEDSKSKSRTNLLADSMLGEHPFINFSNTSAKFCEKCFKRFDTKNVAVRCESCHYICHKICRNTVTVLCTGQRKDGNDEYKLEPTHMKSKRLIEKFYSLQKELQVSQSMKSGLEKIKEAKHEKFDSPSMRIKENLKEKMSKDMAILSQEKQLEKKINFLLNDLTVCKVELASVLGSFLRTVSDEEVQKGIWQVEELDSTLRNIFNSIPETMLLRVFLPSTEDILRPSRTRKTISVKKQINARELVDLLLSKVRSMSPSNNWLSVEYAVVFEDFEGNEWSLEDDDLPVIVQHILGETHFYLKSKELINGTTHKSLQNKNEESKAVVQKRISIISELHETEKNYLNNIQLVIKYFFLPLSNSGLVPRPTVNGLFGNIQDISNLHGKIVEHMKARLSADPEYKNKISDIFQDKLGSLKLLYLTYCVNQNNSQRTLKKLKENPEFIKFIKECENRPQLARLSLSDILIQPMHRITRYPIILKRLLNSVSEDHPDYKDMSNVIQKIEEIVKEINDVVKKKEAEYRIRFIQHCMDWNGFDTVPLTKDRTYIAEKPFTLIQQKKSVEVLFVLLSDLILLLIHKVKEEEEFLLFKPPIPLPDALLVSVPSQKEDGLVLQNLFRLYHLGKDSYLFQSVSNTDKISWIEEIENTALLHRQAVLNKGLSHKINFSAEEAEVAQLNVQKGQPSPSILSSLLNLRADLDEDVVQKKNTVLSELKEKKQDLKRRSFFDIFSSAKSLDRKK